MAADVWEGHPPFLGRHYGMADTGTVFPSAWTDGEVVTIRSDRIYTVTDPPALGGGMLTETDVQPARVSARNSARAFIAAASRR